MMSGGRAAMLGAVLERWLGAGLVAVAYLLGAVSFALLVARRRGVDLRSVGSGNAGATNVSRTVGRVEGRWVLLLDACKGALPVAVARVALGDDDAWVAAVGVAAVLGHCWPVWHGWRGGKGAATGVGVMFAAVPLAGALALAAYASLRTWTGRASVGSLSGAIVGAAATAALVGPWSPRGWMGMTIAGLVWFRHAENLKRLAQGTEPRS